MNICSLWFLLVLAGCIFSKRVTGAKSSKRGQNVGTVLFEKNDYGKQCWTSEEFAVLSSRRIFQGILPEVKVIDPQNDRYIAHLMDYFHTCLENVRRLSVGKTKHLMLKALADTLGGYLRVYILPLTRHSYYAGNIKYRNAKMLFELFDELKTFLRTNGAGWSKPRQDVRDIKIPPITVTPPKTSLACNELITYSAPFKRNSGDYRSFTFKRKKRSTVKRGNARHAAYDYNKETATNEIIIPLPFLDNEVEPNSIALPFKNDSLQSMYSERSAFALVRYYIISAKCIASQPSSTRTRAFNQDFHNWLRQSVLRHLDDEKWYPAFGGVLRVTATLRESGLGEDVAKNEASGTYQMMPKITAGHKGRTDKSLSLLHKAKEQNDDTSMLGTTEIVIISVVSALVLWLLVGLCLVCYRFLSKESEECPPCESKTTPFAVLYKNADYCEPDTCPSRSSHTGVVEKLKEWWRSRFGRCPGGCQKHEDEERCLAAINYSSKDTVSNGSRIYSKRKLTKSTSAFSSGSFRGCASSKHNSVR